VPLNRRFGPRDDWLLPVQSQVWQTLTQLGDAQQAHAGFVLDEHRQFRPVSRKRWSKGFQEKRRHGGTGWSI